MIIIPYVLTYLTGTLITSVLLKDEHDLDRTLFCGFALLAGISASTFLTFVSFMCLNRFDRVFITFLHTIAILGLAVSARRSLNQLKWKDFFIKPSLDFVLVVLAAGALSYAYAKAYPFGGWDAWQVWNFKAKFLLLAGDRWKELFTPILWRSSPHYPLALPLFNAWTWAFTRGTPSSIPLMNTVIFNITAAILMLGIIRQKTHHKFSAVPIVILFCIPLYMILATSQYCDILIGIFLLGALGAVQQAQSSSAKPYLVLTGIFIGTLSFTKPEGAILAAIVFVAAHILILKNTHRPSGLVWFWASALTAGIPTILFQLFLSPGNQTFINGISSAIQPAALMRLKIILAFLCVELASIKWGFLWWLILLAGVLNFNRIFRKEFIIFPGVIFCYMLVVLLYYWVNTYFKIEWWLLVSLSRILSALIPAVITWISIGILAKKGPGQ